MGRVKRSCKSRDCPDGLAVDALDSNFFLQRMSSSKGCFAMGNRVLIMGIPETPDSPPPFAFGVELDSGSSSGGWRQTKLGNKQPRFGSKLLLSLAAGKWMNKPGKEARLEYTSGHTARAIPGTRDLLLLTWDGNVPKPENWVFALEPANRGYKFRGSPLATNDFGLGRFRPLIGGKPNFGSVPVTWWAYETDFDPQRVWIGGALKAGGQATIKGWESISGIVVNPFLDRMMMFEAETSRTGLGLGAGGGAALAIFTGIRNPAEIIGHTESQAFDANVSIGGEWLDCIKTFAKAKQLGKLFSMAHQLGRLSKLATKTQVGAATEKYGAGLDIGKALIGAGGGIDSSSKAASFIDVPGAGVGLEVSFFTSKTVIKNAVLL